MQSTPQTKEKKFHNLLTNSRPSHEEHGGHGMYFQNQIKVVEVAVIVNQLGLARWSF
jgi:hypothetical protein